MESREHNMQGVSAIKSRYDPQMQYGTREKES